MSLDVRFHLFSGLGEVRGSSTAASYSPWSKTTPPTAAWKRIHEGNSGTVLIRFMSCDELEAESCFEQKAIRRLQVSNAAWTRLSSGGVVCTRCMCHDAPSRPQFVQNSLEHAYKHNALLCRIANCGCLPIVCTACYLGSLSHELRLCVTSQPPPFHNLQKRKGSSSKEA